MAKQKDPERESLVSRADWLFSQSQKAQNEMYEAVRDAAAAGTRERQALALWDKVNEAVREYDRKKRSMKRTGGNNG